MLLNINSDAAVVFTNKLEKLHRSALPNAIRNTLNKAAFTVKQVTMPKSAERFIKRQPNFFKANSGVQMATGFDVNSMRATVGFVAHKLRNPSTNFSIKELEEQEYGGDITHRSFIPLNTARAGGSHVRNVRPVNRLSRIKNIVDAAKLSGKGAPKTKFIRAAIRTAHSAQGGHVLGDIKGKRGTRTLWRIDSVMVSGGKIHIKKTPLYSFRENRDVGIKSTGFMHTASIQSANQLDKFYIAEAERQINRIK